MNISKEKTETKKTLGIVDTNSNFLKVPVSPIPRFGNPERKEKLNSKLSLFHNEEANATPQKRNTEKADYFNVDYIDRIDFDDDIPNNKKKNTVNYGSSYKDLFSKKAIRDLVNQGIKEDLSELHNTDEYNF